MISRTERQTGSEPVRGRGPASPTIPAQNAPALGRQAARPVPAAPVRARRRPALVALGVALVAAGGLGATWVTTSTTDTQAVLALTHDIAEGQVLTAGDLATVRASLDPALQIVPATQEGMLIGQRAATRLLAGSLLTPSSTSPSVVPDEGESVVGVSLATSQIPAEPLQPGDHVRIVSTPPAQADPPASVPDVMEGVVVVVSAADAAGTTTVDVLVPSLEAAELAARAATGRVALVLDSRSS